MLRPQRAKIEQKYDMWLLTVILSYSQNDSCDLELFTLHENTKGDMTNSVAI